MDQAMDALRKLEKREQQVVLSTIATLLDLQVAPISTAQTSVTQLLSSSRPSDEIAQPRHQAPQSTNGGSLAGVDIRALKEKKKPTSATQMACLVAFYLQELAPDAEKKTEIATADVEKYMKQAAFKLPVKLDQLLPDTKAAGYLESVSRGKYRLTRVGYNLVTHSMPKTKAEA
jgi:hypothetical protein